MIVERNRVTATNTSQRAQHVLRMLVEARVRDTILKPSHNMFRQTNDGITYARRWRTCMTAINER
jgi:hypothetical protein